MTSLPTLIRLRAVQRRLQAVATHWDERTLRTQYHPDLSPLGWHIGHCAFIENLWLRERIQGDRRATRGAHALYIPQYSRKTRRGRRLPRRRRLLKQLSRQQDANVLLLSGFAEPLNETHPLLADEYLERFIIQHHAQHLETMQMVLQQRALSAAATGQPPPEALLTEPRSPRPLTATLPHGTYAIGGQPPDAFDNELPVHEVDIPACTIASEPVSNADYLAFMQAGGYRNTEFWDTAGQTWLAEQPRLQAPEHWRQAPAGGWYAITPGGPAALDPAAPVMGINHHEAQAYACWAGARLPHEYEWEAAYRAGLLQSTAQVWEWCANPFFAYPGFRAFPYEEYSKPWFDGTHFTLRGGSRYSRADIRRASFRNFHTPEKRYIFAGLRLAASV